MLLREGDRQRLLVLRRLLLREEDRERLLGLRRGELECLLREGETQRSAWIEAIGVPGIISLSSFKSSSNAVNFLLSHLLCLSSVLSAPSREKTHLRILKYTHKDNFPYTGGAQRNATFRSPFCLSGWGAPWGRPGAGREAYPPLSSPPSIHMFFYQSRVQMCARVCVCACVCVRVCVA